jgi:death on curing protein
MVHEIHTSVLKAFGGSAGLRDEGLLMSAVFAAQSTFGGKSPYKDLVEIGSAYLFSLCCNHPFVDGNKRTAMTAAIVFLRLNGIETKPDSATWEKLMLEVASGKIDREETARRLRRLVRSG